MSNNTNIGKTVIRKNLRGFYNKYVVIGFSDSLGYRLFEQKTEVTLNVSTQLFNKDFKILK
jgi:hypothetical protein